MERHIAPASPVPGQFDDACLPADASPSPPKAAAAAAEAPSAAPAGCATRTRLEDARAATSALRETLGAIEPGVLRSLVRARETAAGLATVFPEGDQRFASVDSEDEGAEEGDDDEGEEEEQDECEEECAGLLDSRVDLGPRAALSRAKEEHGLDLRAEMARGGLGTFERIRLANFVRRRVAAGDAPAVVVQKVREVVDAGVATGVLADDALLQPVVPGDVLLTALEDFDVEECDVEDVADAIRDCLEIETLTQ